MNSKDLLNIFHNKWQQKYQMCYPRKVNPKHLALLKQLLDLDYSSKDIINFITEYLKMNDDSFILENGHSIEIFRVKIPAIIARLNKKIEVKLNYHPDLSKIEEARNGKT